MTHLTDDDLGDLLTEAFTAHEYLADPERAAAIARTPGTPTPRRPVLLASAAAVALVAAGTALVATWQDGSGRTEARTTVPSQTAGGAHQPPLPPPETDAGNRAAAVRAADAAVASLQVYPGARETDASGVPELRGQNVTIAGPSAYTVTRQRWWTLTGATADSVAHWYARHAPAGFLSEGVGGEGDGTTWVTTADFTQPNGDRLPPNGVSIEVQTTDTGSGVAIRAVVLSAWPPARPAASYVQDVTSIDVRVVETHLNQPSDDSRRSFTVSAPGRVLRIATVFDSLRGYPPFLHGCPLIQDITSYRIVFHTATGDVTAGYASTDCSTGMSVRRDGASVPPTLAGADRVIALLPH